MPTADGAAAPYPAAGVARAVLWPVNMTSAGIPSPHPPGVVIRIRVVTPTPGAPVVVESVEPGRKPTTAAQLEIVPLEAALLGIAVQVISVRRSPVVLAEVENVEPGLAV